MKAVAYIRVSTQEQVNGYSLDAQERMFLELCKNRGWEPVNVYREEGRSAHVDSISKRPVFRQLLEDARNNQFDVIVVHTLDRWARNTRIALESLGNLAKNNVGPGFHYREHRLFDTPRQAYDYHAGGIC